MVPSIDARVRRAQDLLAGLDHDIKEFCARKSYEVLHEVDVISGQKTATFRTTEEIPLKWSMVVGDLIHNLRSALDHAVYHLSVKHSGSPVAKSEFPIFTDSALFDRKSPGGGRHKIRGLSQRLQEVVESLQPYHLQGQDQMSVLWMLHELSNIDKHRLPHFCRLSPTMMRLELVQDVTSSDDILWNLPIGILPESALLAQWKPVGGLDRSEVVRVHVDIEIVFDPAFIENIWTKPAVEICRHMVTGVEKVLHILDIES